MNAIFPIGENNILFMLKPDAIKRNLEERIRKELIDLDFSIISENKKILSSDEVKLLYQESFRRDFPKGENDDRAKIFIDYYLNSPVLALNVVHRYIKKPELFNFAKQVRGDNWIPSKSNKNSIRYKFRDLSQDNLIPKFEDGYLKGPIPGNILHTTLNDTELKNAYSIFFNEPRLTTLNSNKININSNNLTNDITFVITYNNSSSDKFSIKMHNGVSHLISYLKNIGFNVDLKAYSGLRINDIVNELKQLNTRAVGFSTVSSEFSYTSQISNLLKQNRPDLLQIGGGVHFSLIPEDITYTSIDLVVRGEGEIPLKMILNGDKYENIPGLVYKKNNQLIINKTRPWNSENNLKEIANHKIWDQFIDQQQYNHKRILISRGCPFTCSYCSNKELSKVSSGRYTRFRSIDSIELEIELILDQYPNVDTIFLETESLIPSLTNIEEIFKVTNKYKDKIKFGTNIRIGSFKYDFLEKLTKNGIIFANLGLESGNEELRKKILKRNYSNNEVKEIFNLAKKKGLKLHTYNLIGIPFETPEKFNDTINLNLECNPESAQLYIFQPYPGTELYHISINANFLKDPKYYYTFSEKERKVSVLELPTFTKEEIYNKYNEFRSIFG